MRGEELRTRFLALPLPAVLALLDSSDLATDSENSVVAAVGCWVDHNEPTDGESKQLADRLRLVQLSEAYLLTIVPAMPWLAQHLPPQAFGCLMGAYLEVLAVQREGGPIDMLCGATSPRGKGSQVAWFSTSKHAVSAAGATSVLLDDHLMRQLIMDTLLPQLQGANTASSVSPLKLFAHGYAINLSMTLSKQRNALSVQVNTNTPQRTDVEVGVPDWRFPVRCGLSWQVPSWGGYMKVSHTSLPGSRCSLMLPAGKSVANIADIEERLLMGGLLRSSWKSALAELSRLEGAAGGRLGGRVSFCRP